MKKQIIIKREAFESQRQIEWHLRTYGHLPCECGSKHAMLDCPWQKKN